MKSDWYDPIKNISNGKKHGESLENGLEFFKRHGSLGAALHFPHTRPEDNEERWALYALENGKLWICVHGWRLGHIRVVSFRRAKKSERRRYQNMVLQHY